MGCLARRPTAIRSRTRGVTLIESIVVIAVLGVLAAIVASFIGQPIRAYMDVTRRANLVDSADTALLRISREVSAALPNSVRVSAAEEQIFLEFLPIRDGGRYRREVSGSGEGDALDFTSGSDDGFDVLGPPVSVAEGDTIVIYNLGVDADSDVWQGGNRRRYVGAPGSTGHIRFAATGQPFPLESPGARFYVVGAPVSYVCDRRERTLRRYSGYAIQATQPSDLNAPPLNGVAAPLLAEHVVSCDFRYEPGASHRLGQLTLRLTLEAEGEKVSLYREVVVDNDA